MNRMSLALLLGMAAMPAHLISGHPAGVEVIGRMPWSGFATVSGWRHQPRRRTTVAAMRRAARKRRNIRARAPKRSRRA